MHLFRGNRPYIYICFWYIYCSWFYLWHDILRNWHYAALSRTSLTLDTSSPHKCCLMPPQILIQDVEQFQAWQNLGVILDISKSGLSICLCIVWEKRIMWRQHIFGKRSYIADGIVTDTILATPDTLLWVVKIGFIIYKLAKNTNHFFYLLPVDILN